MKEIKFRAWDKNSKTMLYVGDNPSWADTNGKLLDSFEDEDLMQFTGLTDKNGKEIYENDYLETGGTNVWWVVWGSGKYILQNISNGDIIDLNEDRAQRNEVAGNSFESPREHKAMETDL